MGVANFNPRSREGSDAIDEGFADELMISIHAPAKGATLMPLFTKRGRLNFNPRSREGSDQAGVTKKFYDYLFQSTLPRRERQARGCSAPLRQGYFNPRSREGSDGEYYVYSDSASVFQSTLPRRERLAISVSSIVSNAISIHAPAKGATAFINIFSLAVRLFFISSHQ